MTALSQAALPVVDVWSRTATKYRVRAVIMLIILAVLFAGLCCFTFWLRTGQVAPWQSEQYFDLLRSSFRPLGAGQVTLSDFLTKPIPVQEVPVHAVIMGLLFASLCSIPILVSILYRLPFAVLFAAMVFSLAAMPWLGITVLIGCALASMGRFRFTFRYASALIGLLPMAVYFISASWTPEGSPTALAENQALLYAPWVLALLSSCIICAVALAIAKIINFRPGGMPPVLALLFAIPVLLFHTFVGRDELEFRILENEFGRGSASCFAPVDVGGLAGQAATARWSDAPGGSYDDLFNEIFARTRDGLLEKIEQKRIEAVYRCDSFIERFPTSRHVPDALFLKARSLDIRLNHARLGSEHQAEFRADLPCVASRTTWLTLVEQFPRYEGTATAMLSLAILSAADGDLAAAGNYLDKMIERFELHRPKAEEAETPGGLVGSAFKRISPGSSLQLNVLTQVERARALRETLRICAEDPPVTRGDIFRGMTSDDSEIRPIQVLLWLDPFSPSYRYNLERLAATFPNSHVAGYVALRLANLESDPTRRIAALRDAVQSMGNRMEAAEALFTLGDALFEANSLEEARRTFESLTVAFSDSEWTVRAARRIRDMDVLNENSSASLKTHG